MLSIALAVRGRWVTDWWCVNVNRYAHGTHGFYQLRVTTGCNGFAVDWRQFAAPMPIDIRGDPRYPPIEFSHVVDDAQPFVVYWRYADSVWNRFNFSYSSKRGTIGGTYHGRDTEVSAPTWFILLGCAAVITLPARSVLRDRRRRSRLGRGCCPACGYDLRGANHDRCPECGVAVASPVQI